MKVWLSVAERHKGMSDKERGKAMILNSKYITKVCELQAVLASMGIPQGETQRITYELNKMVENAMENTPL